MVSATTLHIDRVHVDYFISSEHPSPTSVQSRLDESLSNDLPAALSGSLAPLLSENDPSIWFIRKLELDVSLNAEWDRDRVAKQWANEITRAVGSELLGNGDGLNAVRFEDRAAYLAAFLADAAAGSAWGKWYYRRYDGLRMLPVSAAIRTAVCNDPATGLAALLRLSRAELSSVLSALTAQDANRVLAGIAGQEQRGDETACLRALCDVLRNGEPLNMHVSEEPAAALRLYLGVCRGHAGLSGLPLPYVSRAVVRIARLLMTESPAARAKLEDAIIHGPA